ncbi:DMT family transporter [Sinomonas sp. ASV322]|uniref:DMT family transporter n=1 Tax=Sinomonas sp. ASV322 TaxID=3041920 RepID=UPI0027DDB279|nr:DMT family transporter [Sinomonas sp. ASV322]MDQ4504034.1 DMT family transporter [Sinomonas sp. ASV322]
MAETTAAARTGTAWTLARTALGPAIGGTTYLAAQYLPLAPYWDAAIRSIPAGILLLVFWRGTLRGVWWGKALVIGTLNIGVFFGLLFVSAQRLPAGVAATLGALATLVALVAAIPILRERIRPIQFAGGLVGVVGVALLVLRGTAAIDPLGVAAGLGSAASLGIGLTLSRRWGKPADLHGLGFAGWTLILGGLVLVPVAFLLEGPPPAFTLPQLGGMAYVSIGGSAIGYGLLLTGVQKLPMSLAAPLPLMSPLAAALSGWLIAGQVLGGLQILGACLVGAAVLLCTLRFRRPPAVREASRTESAVTSEAPARSS